MDLREEATEEDAVEVVELMRHTLLDEFLDGEGMLDFRRAGGKSKQVRRTKPGMGASVPPIDAQGNYHSVDCRKGCPKSPLKFVK